MQLGKSGFFVIVAALAAGIAIAQTSSQSSTSSSKQGGASASASASSSSSKSAHAAGGQSGGGFAQSTLPPTHAILYTPGPNWVRGRGAKEQRLQDHGAYMSMLVQRGAVIFAGPWRDEDGLMAVIRVRSDAEAQSILENDPGAKSGVLVGQVKGWDVVFAGTGHAVAGQLKGGQVP